MPPEVIVGLVSSIVGGLFVAIVNHLFTKRKTDAEAKKLEAEAEKIKVETARLASEVGKLRTAMRNINYLVLYDGRQGVDSFDFIPEPGTSPKDPAKEKAIGTFVVKEGVLMLERKNIGGRFFIVLRSYLCDGKEKDYIPRNDLVEGKRKLRVSFEARVTKGSHTLVLVIKNNREDKWLDSGQVIVDQQEWKQYDKLFRLSAPEDCFFRIDDQQLTEPDSSLHIRNLVLMERLGDNIQEVGV